MLVMNFGCSPHLKQRSEVGFCRSCFSMTSPIPMGRLQKRTPPGGEPERGSHRTHVIFDATIFLRFEKRTGTPEIFGAGRGGMRERKSILTNSIAISIRYRLLEEGVGFRHSLISFNNLWRSVKPWHVLYRCYV